MVLVVITSANEVTPPSGVEIFLADIDFVDLNADLFRHPIYTLIITIYTVHLAAAINPTIQKCDDVLFV